MDQLTKTLCDIEHRLSRIEEKLEAMMPQTQKMAEHVQNVEYVAENTPFLSRLLHWDDRPKRVLTNNEAPWP